jgi:hypothetical protein
MDVMFLDAKSAQKHGENMNCKTNNQIILISNQINTLTLSLYKCLQAPWIYQKVRSFVFIMTSSNNSSQLLPLLLTFAALLLLGYPFMQGSAEKQLTQS